MFVGAQFTHLGQRAREARERPGAAFGFGAQRGLDVMTADNDFDLRQFALNRAGDALDQRDAGGRRRIVHAIGSVALGACGERLCNVALRNTLGRQLPWRIGLVDQRTADLIAGVDSCRAIDAATGGRQRSLAFQNAGADIFLPFPVGLLDRRCFPLGWFFDSGFFPRRFFRRLGAGHTPPLRRLSYRFG